MEFPSLGQFNPSSIKGFDGKSLQKLNTHDIKVFVLDKKFECAAGGIALIAIVATIVILNSSATTLQDLDFQIGALTAKADPIRDYKKAVKNKEAIAANLLPALANEEFIFALTDLASKRKIRITDFTPPAVVEAAFSKKYTSRFFCITPDFRKAILFINDLETAAYSIKIESWTLNPLEASQGFGMALVISSIKIEPDNKAKTKE